ncbi:helicase POLQ-like isoform X1 [Cylas formicarius]|uniref:helicase POLQ-like isoform X1 n=1 Tax=Cylas formicarius TaxID=197179 RepID=UPI0029586870|nr:helicase POLQ-like isoform X1 [Cylas formicarius]
MDFVRRNSSRASRTDIRETEIKGKCSKLMLNRIDNSSGFGSSDNCSIKNSGLQNSKSNLSDEQEKVKQKLKINDHFTCRKDCKTSEGFSETSAHANLDQSEFDAFAQFFNGSNKSTSAEKKCVKRLKVDEEYIFSQAFDTQTIKQIDEEMQKNSNTSQRRNSNSSQNNNDQEIFKLPLLKSFLDRSTTLNEYTNRQSSDKSLLFNDESVTTQYKNEIDRLFQEIEYSVCAMGTSNFERTIPDSVLDVIFDDDITSSTKIIDEQDSKRLKADLSQKFADIDWDQTRNCSFGTIIKQALINNATKNISLQKITKSPLNLTLGEKRAEFRPLGTFYGLPKKVQDLIKQYKGIEELYGWQDDCLKLAINSRKNLVYALPTSGGKTLVAEILMLREVLCYQCNAIFILPYVSIVQEKVWEFSPFGVSFDFLVEEYASNKGTYPPRKRRRKRSVYIATIEKALGLINSLIETGRLNEIGLIVIDELHLIGEEGRGATLESCLTKVLFLNANIQIIGMSATIGNIGDICKFLNANVYTNTFRPVELTEYVKCGNEIARINWNYSDDSDLLVDARKVDYKYSEPVSKVDPDMIGGLALEVVSTGSCLIFCPSKKNCENVTFLLCKLAKPDLKNIKKTEKEQLLNALKSESGELCNILKVSVPFGIAYHHSGLTSDERRLIEDGFRSGTICVICCTSTLAAGVNLPAKRVILRSPYIGRDFISLARYKQMVGRAGRACFGEKGESIVITQIADLPKLKELLMSPMNQALSSLHSLDGKGLRHLLLSCISLGLANTRSQLQAVIRSTLMAVQRDKLEVDIKAMTDNAIKCLFKMGAIEESCSRNKKPTSNICDFTVKLDMTLNNLSLQSENSPKKKMVVLTSNSKLLVSSLGAAAIKGGLEISRAHQLYDDLYRAQKSLVLLDCLHLLYLITPYDTSEQIKPNMQVYYEQLMGLGQKEMYTARVLGFDEATIVKMLSGIPLKNIPDQVLNRFYLTLMLYDLWNETPVFEVSEKYQVDRGLIQTLMTAAATFASNVVNFCEQLEEFWAFSYLLKGMSNRLSHCCVKELLPLMELPAVKQSRAMQLFNAGYKTLQSIAKAKVSDLTEKIEFMSYNVACQLVAASKMLLLERVENLREEAEDVLDGVEQPVK